jgi:hypothetical protein
MAKDEVVKVRVPALFELPMPPHVPTPVMITICAISITIVTEPKFCGNTLADA